MCNTLEGMIEYLVADVRQYIVTQPGKIYVNDIKNHMYRQWKQNKTIDTTHADNVVCDLDYKNSKAV